MRLLNRKSREITKPRYGHTVRFSDRYIYFSVGATELADMRVGMYVHLVEAGPNDKITCFLVNNDPAGFPVKIASNRDLALRACCLELVNYFRKKHNAPEGKSVSYYVQKSDLKYNGQPLFEILTDKPRKIITKKAK